MARSTTPAHLLERAASGTPCPDAAALAVADGQLRTAMAHVRASLGTFDEAEHDAWATYARTVDRALVHLEAELNVSEAELGVRQADNPDELRATLDRARESWLAIGDDLRLQAHLAQLDARDRIDEATSGLQRLIGDLSRRAAHDLDAARHEAGRVLGELLRAVPGLGD